MPKLRVYQLARELNRDNSEIIRELQHMGVPVTSHSNTVEDRLAEALRKKLGVLVVEEPPAAAPPLVEEVRVEAPPPVEAAPPPAETVLVEAAKEPVRVEVKAEPRIEPKAEPKVEEKPGPAPAEKVAAPPVVTPPVMPPPMMQPASGSRPPLPAGRVAAPIVTPPAPPKVELPHEERKTMQQIVQERLRQQHRLPQAPPPGQRRPFDRPGQRPMGPGQPRHPSAPGFQNRGAAPAAPSGTRPWTRPGAAPPLPQPAEQRRGPVHERVDRTQRYERQAEKKLETPYVRPQPKPEPPREFRKVTLTEGLTVKDLAEKLDVRTKDMIRKLMDRGVFATINQTLDKEMAREIAKEFNAEADFVTFEEAVTLMRARVARVTDIVVLVVAADDGVMPQTLESISHTRAAKVPFVVAINKVDKPGVNPERVKRELAEQGLQAEDWGGDTVTVEVSAKTGKNLELLLEMILLVADLQNLKADPSLPAMGTVLEAKIDKGRG